MFWRILEKCYRFRGLKSRSKLPLYYQPRSWLRKNPVVLSCNLDTEFPSVVWVAGFERRFLAHDMDISSVGVASEHIQTTDLQMVLWREILMPPCK